MNRWLVILLVFSLTVNLAAVGSLVFFWQKTDERHRMPPERTGLPRQERPRFQDREPPENWGQIRKMRRDYQGKVRPLVMEIQQNRHELVHLLTFNPAATDSIDSLLQQINVLQARVEKLTVEHLVDVRPLVGDEQWNMLIGQLERRMLDFKRMPRAERPEPMERIME